MRRLVGGDNLIVQAGHLRKVPITLGGTTWRPDMPSELQIQEELAKVTAIDNPTDRAITLMLYLMRKQMFLEGNKRTAMLSGNQVLISSGCGIISIPIEHQRTFTGLLVQYYETNDMSEIKPFIVNRNKESSSRFNFGRSFFACRVGPRPLVLRHSEPALLQSNRR